ASAACSAGASVCLAFFLVVVNLFRVELLHEPPYQLLPRQRPLIPVLRLADVVAQLVAERQRAPGDLAEGVRRGAAVILLLGLALQERRSGRECQRQLPLRDRDRP